MEKSIRLLLTFFLAFSFSFVAFTQTCSITGNNFVCIGSTLTLTGSGTPNVTSPWTSSNMNVATVTSNGIVNAISPGTVIITYTTSTGCFATRSISIRQVPTMTSENTKSICSGDNVALAFTSNLGTGTTFSWSAFNNASVGGETINPQTGNVLNNTLTHGFGNNQSVSYNVTPTFNGCAGATQQVVITVRPRSAVTVTNPTICSGQQTTITSSPSTNGGSYNWSTGAVSSFIVVSPVITTTYTLTYTLSSGCSTIVNSLVTVNPNPVLNFSNATICRGNSGQVTATSSTPGGTYVWSNGTNGATLTASPMSTTNYTVTYNNGICSPVIGTGTIVVNNTASVSLSSTTICQGESATLSPAYSHSSGGTYLWSNGATTATITVSPNTNTNYSVTYTMNGCTTMANPVVSSNATVVVKPISIVPFATDSICSGQNFTIVPSVSPVGGTYLWSTNATSASITVSPTANTTYTLTYSFNGCSTSSSKSIFVKPVPEVVVNPGYSCLNTNTVFTATSNLSNSTFLWSTGATTNTLQVNSSTQVTYSVVTRVNGCNSLPKEVYVTPNITLSSNTNGANVCPGSPYPTITITPSHLGGSYIWSTGGTTNSITPTGPGNYTVSYSLTGCSTATRTISITENNCDFTQNSCSSPNLMCSETSFTYPNATNKPNLGSVDCLGSTPNPTWFYLNISQPGTVTLNLSQTATTGQGLDVDYIVWGPFSSLTSIPGCSSGNFPIGPVASCSYSGNFNETATIQNAQAGQTYVLMVTNFSNQPGNISVVEVNNTGAGSASCSIICDITEFTAVPTACLNNQYNLTGVLTFVNPPTIGTLTVSNSCGGSQVFNAPFTSPLTYNLTGLNANGAACALTATFSASSNCTSTASYTAPASCISPCAIQNVTAVPSACLNNQYSLSGAVTFSNPPSSGTLTVSNSCGGFQTFNAPFTSPLNYSLTGLTANGSSCTISATFSANMSCSASANFTAPAACVSPCSIQSLTAVPSTCFNNLFNVSGSINFTNPPSSGTLTVTSSCGGTQTLNAPFTSPLNYNLSGLNANGASCSITATFSANSSCNRTTNFTAPAPCVLPCSIQSLTAVPSNCLNNQYSLSGSITFTNPPSTGSLTVTSSCGGTQTLNAPFTSPLNYNLTGLTANGANCTVTAAFSANSSCNRTTNFTAPTPCISPCSIQNVTAIPSTCLINQYSLSGTVSFSNPPSTGTLTVTNSCGGTQTFNAPFSSSINYSFTNLIANGNNCTVTASFSAAPTCTASSSYTSPAPCILPCSIQNVTVVPSACFNNQYSLSGTVSFSNPPSTGTLTVTNSCGGTQIFNAPFSSSINYSFTDLTANGNNCTVTTSFSATPACSASSSYTAPEPCVLPCSIQSVTAVPSNCLDNLYLVFGTVTFSNPPTSGTLTVSSSCGGTQTFNPPFSSPINYVFSDLTANGNNCTVTASFSTAPTCSASSSYTAPAPCLLPCSIQNLTAIPSSCLDNLFTLSGNVTFSNPPTSGSLTVTNSCGNTLTFNAPFSSPINYSFTDLDANGANCSVTATFSAAPTCSQSTSYTAPVACGITSCVIQSINALPSTCSSNLYDLDGTLIFSNPPSTGTLTITACGTSITLNPPFTSPLNFSVPNLTANGNNCSVSASFSALSCQASSSFTAPVPCDCSLNTIAISGTTDACIGQNSTLTATVGLEGGNFFWYPGGETTQTITISPTEITTYEVYYSISVCPQIGEAWDVYVTEPTIPFFNQVPEVCVGASLSLPPNNSLNNILGTWSPSANNQETTTYTFTPNQGICANTTTMTIGVNSGPTFTLPQNQSICVGDNFATSVFADAPSGTIFSWTNDNPSIGLAASGSGDITGFEGLNTTTSNQTAIISVEASLNGCSTPVQTFELTVKPRPTAIASISNQDNCCGNTSTEINFTSNLVGTTYNWTNDNPNIGLGTSGAGTITAFTVFNPTSVDQTATLTVTPEFFGCAGTPITTSILAHPCLTVTNNSIAPICAGETTQPIQLTSSVAGVTFDWTNSNTSVGLQASGNGVIPSFTAINTSQSPNTSSISVTPSLGSCTGDAVILSLVVNPIPSVTVNSLTICEGQSGTLTAVPSILGGTYSWTSTGQTSSSITVNPTTNTNFDVIYTLNGCSSNIATAQVDVIPSVAFTISAAGPTTINQGESVVLTSSYSTADFYQWYFNGQLIAGANSVSYTANTTGNYTLEIQVGSCPSVSNPIQVTVQNETDTDGDGVVDNGEVLDGTDANDPCSFVLANQTVTPSTAWLNLDCDGDDLTNGEEGDLGTDPLDPDTDGDTFPDGGEVDAGTDPLDPNDFPQDADGDGVPDNSELADGTNPNDQCDFVLANQVLAPSTIWNTTDCDLDGVINQEEILIGTNPLNPDTDSDGVIDGTEIAENTSPLDPCDLLVASQTILPAINWNLLDCDSDGLTNGNEITANTDPFNPDSDGDGVIDGTEVTDATNPLGNCSFVLDNQTLTPSTIWTNLDCDFDGLPNGEEVTIGSNPLNPDTDGDGVTDSQEVTDNTSPTNPCSFILSSQTLVPTTAWNQQDCDTDDLTNEEEVTTGTNPTNPDTDGDGVIDGTEITDSTNPLEACSFILTSQTVTPSLAWNSLDCDEDGLTNEEEVTGGTNPTNADTDGDGVIDGTEITDLTDPLVACNFILASQTVAPSIAWNSLDCDEDGLTNEEEITGGSNPLNACDPTNSGPNCQDTVLIQIPEIFTPNNDGINETFEIPGLEDYPNNSIQIFNRWGSTVLNAAPYENNWNGNSTSNLILGEAELPTGTYYYILDLNGDGSTIYKGYVYLKR